MSGVLAVLSGLSGMLVAAMTVGNNAGNFGYVNGLYGALSPASYTDRSPASRTVVIWNWDNTASGTVGFRLSGTGIANSDTTFSAIDVGGRQLNRSAASYTANDGSGNTQWTWSTNTSAYPTSGVTTVSVR